MTPLEARRKLFNDHVFDKEKTNKMIRASSRERVNKVSSKCLQNNKHVDDRIRRKSSFYKRHEESVMNLLR